MSLYIQVIYIYISLFVLFAVLYTSNTQRSSFFLHVTILFWNVIFVKCFSQENPILACISKFTYYFVYMFCFDCIFNFFPYSYDQFKPVFFLCTSTAYPMYRELLSPNFSYLSYIFDTND